MNRTIIYRILWLCFLSLLFYSVFSPIFAKGLLVTDDGDWMVIRLSAFYQSFRDGQFPVRFLGRLNFSYGYPVANFLYPGFLYAGSFLHVLGLSFTQSTEFLIIGSVLIGMFFLYKWLRCYFDERASILGTASFLLMPYLLYDIFRRGSVGELFSIGTCIVALYAVETKNRWLLPPAIGLLAISHNTLAMFYIPVLFGLIILKKYWDLTLPFFIGFGMSLFFWLPAIFERRFVSFDAIAISNPRQYFMTSKNLLLQGLPFIFAVFIVYFRHLHTKHQKEFYYFALLVFVGMFLTSGIGMFIWDNAQFIKYIQFPFRLFALWIFAGPWFIAALANNKKDVISFMLSLVFIGVLCWFAFPYRKAESIIRPEGFYTTNEGTTTVANEYMPVWATSLPAERAQKRIELYKGNALFDEHRVSVDKIDITIQAKEESILQINTIYYPGWGAMIDNKPATIIYDNPMGLMRVTIPVGVHRLFMAFRETGWRFAADMISFTSGIVYFVLFGFPSVLGAVSRLVKKRK
jgi:hypothetical protein